MDSVVNIIRRVELLRPETTYRSSDPDLPGSGSDTSESMQH
jgi:hypothetical protein